MTEQTEQNQGRGLLKEPSGLVLLCLPYTFLKDTRHRWVNMPNGVLIIKINTGKHQV